MSSPNTRFMVRLFSSLNHESEIRVSYNMKNQDALVSIAIITYNQKEYLKECIESVLAQDYSNIEIVVGDDCSTDGTQELLREYAREYPDKFILMLSEINKGITGNSNAVHFACTGKYIAWMGGDDLMLPGKISQQVDFMENNSDCAICYHDLDVFDNNTGETLYRFNEKHTPHEGGVIKSIRYGTFNGACSTMLLRDCAPLNGFDSSIPIASDWLYWVETLIGGSKIRYINTVLGRHRRHSNNVTNKSSSMAQIDLDQLATCNLILFRYPQYFRAVLYRLGSVYVSMRHKGHYYEKVVAGLKLNFKFVYVAILLIYILSFGKIKK